MRTATAPYRVVLSGGSTPRATYQLLAGMDVDWSCSNCSSATSASYRRTTQDSNYRMVRESLLAGGKVQPRKLLAIPTDGTPQSAADRYDEALRQQYGAGELEPGVPLFHLTLAGFGR